MSPRGCSTTSLLDVVPAHRLLQTDRKVCRGRFAPAAGESRAREPERAHGTDGAFLGCNTHVSDDGAR